MPREALFELAVDRAARYADRLGVLGCNASREALRDALELWYLRTRFAYRVPLGDVIRALEHYPGAGYVWRGGVDGDWCWQEDGAT